MKNDNKKEFDLLEFMKKYFSGIKELFQKSSLLKKRIYLFIMIMISTIPTIATEKLIFIFLFLIVPVPEVMINILKFENINKKIKKKFEKVNIETELIKKHGNDLILKNTYLLNKWTTKKEELKIIFNKEITKIDFYKSFQKVIICFEDCNFENKIDKPIIDMKNDVISTININKNVELTKKVENTLISRINQVCKNLKLNIEEIKEKENPVNIKFIIKSNSMLKDWESQLKEISHQLGMVFTLKSKDGYVELSTAKKDNIYRFEDIQQAVNDKHDLCVLLGYTEDGEQKIINLIKNTHWLIAGTTGGGKSNLIDVMLCSIFTAGKDNVFLHLFDPKKVGLKYYERYKNVRYSCEDNLMEAQLVSCLQEMNTRNNLFAKLGYTDIEKYNENEPNKLGYQLIIVEEFAHFDKKSAFAKMLKKLLEQGRSSGFRIFVITQYPSIDIIPNTLKTNMPNRICLPVADGTASKVVLDIVDMRATKPGEIVLKNDREYTFVKVPMLESKEKILGDERCV